MKPIKLTMTAFGPYKNTEVIDFTELDDHHLFVISGNTGAGKTTIFDGISFALYGSASGQDRGETKLLRSDFADDDVHTAVELEFLLKGKHYRILRQPGHIKTGNKSKTGEKYEFYQINGTEEISCVDRQIVSEINEKVEEIIGLTQDQFKQIVMLPQGEFRKLLTSDTENKEAILRRLFKTESYKAINETLKNKRSEADITYKQDVHQRDELINNIPAILPIREDAILKEVLSADFYNSSQVLEALAEEAVYFENKITIDDANYKQAVEKSSKKQKELHEASRLNEQFLELEAKEKQLTELESKREEIEEKEKKLIAAEKANAIYMYEHARNQVVEDEKEKTKELESGKDNFQKAEIALDKAKDTYTSEENKKDEREEIAKTLSNLESYLPIVKGLEENKQEVARLQKNETDLKEKLKILQEKLTESEKLTDENKNEIKQLTLEIDKLADKKLELRNLLDQAKVFEKYRKLLQEITEAEKEYRQQLNTYEALKFNYNNKESMWLDNQAFVLAEHLEDGKSCPVCGSTHHPHKAPSHTESISRNELAKLKKELELVEASYQKVSIHLQSRKTQFLEVKEELTVYTTDFETIDKQFDDLVLTGKEVRAAVEKWEQLKETLVKKKEKEEELFKQRTGFEQNYKAMQEQYQQESIALSSAQAVLNERRSKIPEELQTLKILEQRIEATKLIKNKLENAWETAQKELQAKKEAFTKREADFIHLSKQLGELETKRIQATKEFEIKLVEQDFKDEAAYLTAKMSEQERANLRQEIETYKQTRLLITQSVKDLQKELEGKKQINLEELQLEVTQLQENYEKALQELNQTKNNYKEATDLQSKIILAEEKLMESEAYLSLLTDLYDTLRGQNSRKISFERFLQMEYLEQIIHSANLRLQKLSNNQYYLTRSDRQESHGKQSGLALDVYDSHTGQTRDVKSLSGGEKFHAALSLALGMSDVIQSFQGNISIDTMFIDEGFGSLDEEALTKAIDALIELMESGRMIGVISHVKELKDIFPAILEVKKSKEGHSQTAFILK
ncbi:AAA family ATPase [Oceanobacillus sp. CAU 1775]